MYDACFYIPSLLKIYFTLKPGISSSGISRIFWDAIGHFRREPHILWPNRISSEATWLSWRQLPYSWLRSDTATGNCEYNSYFINFLSWASEQSNTEYPTDLLDCISKLFLAVSVLSTKDWLPEFCLSAPSYLQTSVSVITRLLCLSSETKVRPLRGD